MILKGFQEEWKKSNSAFLGFLCSPAQFLVWELVLSAYDRKLRFNPLLIVTLSWRLKPFASGKKGWDKRSEHIVMIEMSGKAT